MTAKIFRNSFLVGISVLLLCGVLFFSLSYSRYQERFYTELSSEAAYIAHGIALSGIDYLETMEPESRITWVGADGTVLYDSEAQPEQMENHAGREEIAAALATGSGTSAHYSETMMEKTLYYALRLEDGSVLRLSCTKKSVAAMLLLMAAPILWALILVLALSGVMSFRLAKQITKPINSLNLDHPNVPGVYKELAPLVSRIREQNLTIRQQMDELRQKQREFSAITENMTEGFLLIDRQSVILGGNRSALQMTGGLELGEKLCVEGCEPEIRRAAESALKGRRAETLLPLNGQTWQVIANPVSARQRVSGGVILIMDVTEREQREQLRREFSANVSHELKTPLTSISGFAELMKEGLVPGDKAKEFAGDIFRESRRLIALVDDIINLSRLDESSLPEEFVPVELYHLAREVLDSLQSVSKSQGVRLELQGGPAIVSGVAHILREMVYNLCDNAIKYNRPGGSAVVRVEAGSEEARLSVSDTGIGIPYGEQSRVFERFYRVDKSHSKEIGGTGLGLSIVKHGAQYHNARIELKSEPNVGTVITLLFEKKQTLPATGQAPEHP